MDDLRNLSRNERRKLKRQRRQENEKSQKKNKKIKNTLKFLIPAITLIVIGGVFATLSLAEAPVIQVTPSRHDFGNVVAGGNVVSALMDITNVGKSDLTINNMDSSCGCTSASMVVDGIEGPRFSMSSHGTNPMNWHVTLEPGESSQLKVYYDPSVHSDHKGPVTRFVTLYSSDPLNSQMKIIIEANQI